MITLSGFHCTTKVHCLVYRNQNKQIVNKSAMYDKKEWVKENNHVTFLKRSCYNESEQSHKRYETVFHVKFGSLLSSF